MALHFCPAPEMRIHFGSNRPHNIGSGHSLESTQKVKGSCHLLVLFWKSGLFILWNSLPHPHAALALVIIRPVWCPWLLHYLHLLLVTTVFLQKSDYNNMFAKPFFFYTLETSTSWGLTRMFHLFHGAQCAEIPKKAQHLEIVTYLCDCAIFPKSSALFLCMH